MTISSLLVPGCMAPQSFAYHAEVNMMPALPGYDLGEIWPILPHLPDADEIALQVIAENLSEVAGIRQRFDLKDTKKSLGKIEAIQVKRAMASQNGVAQIQWMLVSTRTFDTAKGYKSKNIDYLGLGCDNRTYDHRSAVLEVSSSAEYIIQHFMVATVCRTLEGTVRVPHKGCFVIWQMVPNKWLIELAVGGHNVVAGSDGNVAWRHTPWLESHAAQGGVRSLRHALQARTYITKT
ncbi:DUF620 domain-containing protein [Tanacetum coccineum]